MATRLKLAVLVALIGLAACSGSQKPGGWTTQDREAVAHVLAKGSEGQGITLDLSDPKSGHFLKRHYEASGLTADRYPGLHQLMTDQAKLMATKGVTMPKVTALSDDLLYQDIATVMLGLYKSAPQTFTAAAAATMEASADDPDESLQLAYSSLCFYDPNNQPIGTCVTSNSFGTGQYFPVQNVLSTGDTDFTAVHAASYYDVTHKRYIAQVAQLSSDAIAAPFQQTISNPIIVNPGNVGLKTALVCTSRATAGVDPGTGGVCDYGTYQSTRVLVSMQGSVTYQPSQTPQTDASGDLVGSGVVSLMNQSQGGQCILSPTISGNNFFKNTAVSYNPATKLLQWNFPGLDFGPAGGIVCGGNSTNIVFRLLTSVTDMTTNQPVVASQYSVPGTTVPTPIGIDAGAFATPMLRVVAGCLHPDTRIALPGQDGERAIKLFKGGGERVRSARGSNHVVGTVNGTEKGVLYEVKAANGLAVRASDLHPFVTQKGDYRAARDLKPGDMVVTARGVAAIERVTQIPYAGDVHNLVLAHPAHVAVTPATESFYANGFLVGGHDAQQQVAQAKRRDPRRVRALLPAQFAKDYSSHVEAQTTRR